VTRELVSVAPSPLERAKDLLRRRLGAGARTVTLPAPRAWDAAALWDRRGDAVLWHAPGEAAVAGLGSAAVLRPRGSDRFARLDEEARGLLAELGDARLFGGFAFTSGAADEAPWAALGDGCFVLPRWTYELGESATLRFVRGDEDGDVEGELETIWRRLERSTPPALDARVNDVHHEAFAPYARRLRQITRAIDEGHLEKAVLARRAEVVLDAELDPRSVLERLRTRFAGCTRFAIRREGTTFLGATPERLVARRGDRVRSVALAGTVPRGAASRMLESAKERREHRLVIDAIVRALGPHCAAVTHADAPVVRELPDVLHMETRVEGRLRDGASVLRLAETLHPTPAVGGVPKAAALASIGREASPRGWYASPFGWVDGQGDGELVVALRSGVLEGARAWAWAGGGIVAGSEAGAEYEESALKLRAMLWALGREG